LLVWQNYPAYEAYMPIHLPPISRRKFLTRAVAAGAGLALKPALLADGQRTEQNSWALLSDIHLAADRAQVARGINMSEHFSRVSGEVLALKERPAGLFITGDCAYNNGEKGDYAVLLDSLDPIRKSEIPVHLALGNHDHRDRFREVLEQKGAARPVPDHHVSLLKTEQVNWLILDSLEKTLSTPGLLGPEQLQWLARTLDDNRDRPAVIMIHHNPGVSGNISGLKDSEAFFEVIRPRKQVKAYFFGHTHVWKVDQDSSGIHLINLPPVAYIFREGDPAGWVNARVNRNGMRLELKCLDTNHKAHGQVVDLKWRA
jgi:3',5'-cyclic AMP phosphodiesterase CpdA